MRHDVKVVAVREIVAEEPVLYLQTKFEYCRGGSGADVGDVSECWS